MKAFLGMLAVALTFLAFLPYIRSISQGKTKPHVFSWIIWSSLTFVVFLAQLADQGGAGAWSIGVSGIITLVVALLAYHKKAEIDITRSDWVFFMAALSALPLWYVTANPLWAVLVLTTVDVLGLAPTLRKAYWHPFEEQAGFFMMMAVRNAVSIAALENYSLTTVLFPATTGLACIGLVLMLWYRRRQLRKG